MFSGAALLIALAVNDLDPDDRLQRGLRPAYHRRDPCQFLLPFRGTKHCRDGFETGSFQQRLFCLPGSLVLAPHSEAAHPSKLSQTVGTAWILSAHAFCLRPAPPKTSYNQPLVRQFRAVKRNERQNECWKDPNSDKTEHIQTGSSDSDSQGNNAMSLHVVFRDSSPNTHRVRHSHIDFDTKHDKETHVPLFDLNDE